MQPRENLVVTNRPGVAVRRLDQAYRGRSWRPWVAALTVVGLLGCSPTLHVQRLLTPPEAASRAHAKTKVIKVHRRDGRLYVLSDWSVDEQRRTLSGRGVSYGLDRSAPDSAAPRQHELAFADVALVESNVALGSNAVAALTVVTGLSLAVTVACALNPKACFGSCPTFYVSDGERERLQAEGFSGSILPALSASDTDALYHARAVGGRVEMRMVNEAYETHVVKEVALLVAPRPDGGRVYRTPDGAFLAARGWQEPALCRAEEGDCETALHAVDGQMRASLADAQDLAARETIELRFASGTGRRGLVVASSQSLMSTFLFYQTLAYLGRDAGRWLAQVEAGDQQLLTGLRGLERTLGKIEASVLATDGQWRAVGVAGEPGPLATDVVVLPLPEQIAEPPRLRLRLARGLWRLDAVALTRIEGPVAPVRIAPREMRVVRQSAYRSAPLALSWPLATLPGDELGLVFDLPSSVGSPELFLTSSGYYLEWLREEWLKDEDPAQVGRLFARPEVALREWAPAFKRAEPGMNETFWRSRYAQP